MTRNKSDLPPHFTSVLNDEEIKELLRSSNPAVQNFPHTGGWDTASIDDPEWNNCKSPIQPCSLDLHIGEIYIPDTPEGSLGHVKSGGHKSYTLDTGMSVVIKSLEKINLPDTIGAIALPPSSISSQGILIANIGHIDPGYDGHLRFTFINMGKCQFKLKQEDIVITLLLFRINSPRTPLAHRPDYKPREDITQKEVDCHAKDFADISNRARKISQEELGASGYRYLLYRGVIPVAAAFVGALLSLFVAFYGWYEARSRSIERISTEIQTENKHFDEELKKIKEILKIN